MKKIKKTINILLFCALPIIGNAQPKPYGHKTNNHQDEEPRHWNDTTVKTATKPTENGIIEIPEPIQYITEINENQWIIIPTQGTQPFIEQEEKRSETIKTVSEEKHPYIVVNSLTKWVIVNQNNDILIIGEPNPQQFPLSISERQLKHIKEQFTKSSNKELNCITPPGVTISTIQKSHTPHNGNNPCLEPNPTKAYPTGSLNGQRKDENYRVFRARLN